ncbi:MAG TPA: DUF2933 domain-containing protein [Casimicrobiaceae bacterium]|nr:DUF2933 domain-containing protein [Casimicrobiaceae bacterium]
MNRDARDPQPRIVAGKFVLIGFLLIAGFFLVTEHRAHLYGALPLILLLGCPLLHLFHGHGHHGGSKKDGDSRAEPGNGNSGPPQHGHH